MPNLRHNTQKSSLHYGKLYAYLHIHLHSFFSSLGRLARTPFNFMMTVGVIGITLSLPAGMLVSIDNLKAISGQINLNQNISVFLKHSVNHKDARKLTEVFQKNPSITKAVLIDKQAALDEFKEYSGFGAALNALGENPLPHVIQLTPIAGLDSTIALSSLLNDIKQHNAVQLAQLDMTWVERLNALLSIAERSVSLITFLLGIAVLLIISNTIRLELQARREEIEITRLVGATQAFIRRPFVYSGFWYGLSGGILACLLVDLSLWLLDGPTSTLSKLYGSNFDLHYLGLGNVLMWLCLSILLGIVGSWVVVHRHLSNLEDID